MIAQTRIVLNRTPYRFPTALFLVLTLAALALPAQGYIGPGAGFALLSSFLVVFTTIFVAIVAVLLWPFRMLYRLIKVGKRPKPWVRRLIVVGRFGRQLAGDG